MKRIASLFATILMFSSGASADISEPEINVSMGENTTETPGLYMGLWRFADRPEGDAIGSYACEKVTLGKPEDNNVEIWYFGPCDVIFSEDDLGISGNIVFEFKAEHAFVGLNVAPSGVVTFTDPLRAGSTLSLLTENGVEQIRINVAETNVEPNGFTGVCGYEYIYASITPKPASRNSCDGQPTYLPLDTTWGFFVAGRVRNPVHVSHWGVLYPKGNGRAYAKNSTLGFRTIEVVITPSTIDPWNLEGVDTVAVGERTLRLGQSNQYHLSVPYVGEKGKGVVFQLPDECGDLAHRIDVPDVGPFFVQVLCGTELPTEASNAG